MNLSPVSQKAYERWITNPTWHLGEPLDRLRFYDFVSCCARCENEDVCIEDLDRDIKLRCQHGFDQSYLDTKAKYYSTLFGSLLGYIKNT